MVSYTDSDYAGATQDRKSTSRGCQFLGNRLISWQCKKQTVVATSTTEAEYVATSSCCGQDQKHLCISKEVDTPRYLSLVVPLTKVGDGVVHKELGDRIERAATTTSSLEAEHDSGSGPRCQDTILGDVNAQTSPKFAETQNVVAFLEKPIESDGFAEIIDFVKASSVHYALAVNPIIYTFCVEQFLTTAKVQTVNGVRQLQALVDKRKVFITESSIRSDLYLDDAKGTDCLPTATIFEELARMGARSTAWNEFSSTMASLIICLATNQKFNLSKYIFDAMVKHLDGGVEFLMYPLFANMKRAGKDFSGRITPLFDTMMVQASKEVGEDSNHPTDSTQVLILDQPSTSSKPKMKQPSKKTQRQEAEVFQDETEHEESVLDLEKAKSDQAIEIASLKKRVDKLEKRRKFRTLGLKRLKKVGATRRIESSNDSLGTQEDASKQERRIKDIDVDVEVTLVNETLERQDEDLMFDTRVLDDDEVFVDVTTVEKEEQSTKTGEAVTTAGVEDSAAPTIPTTVEETLAQTLMEIKAAKPKAKGIVFHDMEKQVSKPTVSITQPSIIDKGKGIMQEPERPLTKKDQVALDRLLPERLQTREREELTDEEKGKLLMELMEKRRKHFATLRAAEKRNRPPTKAYKRSQMSTYLKHMGGYKHKQLMGKSYDEIQELFDKEIKRVNTFVAMSSETQESNEKKVEDDDKETDEHEEVEADDTAKLKKHLVIKKYDDIATDVIPLSTKPPVIVDYKLLKEGIM
ncbi:hypothetical protein Tco_1287203, partial [Tanacetum coccineum]